MLIAIDNLDNPLYQGDDASIENSFYDDEIDEK